MFFVVAPQLSLGIPLLQISLRVPDCGWEVGMLVLVSHATGSRLIEKPVPKILERCVKRATPSICLEST